ncbi:MAG: DNA-binding protein [Roseitalea porphyridii]|jgi:predicted DNA-binding protein with PD1-like motif|uniref:PPC domain-containing DNA-binding protein n=1 Tax=Alphaproteobacteria TaxID=28211 RepID=UPI0032EBCE8B
MGELVRAEAGSVGRVVYGRVRPNEDLVTAIETVCDEAGVLNGFIRGSLGSLTDACVDCGDGSETVVYGPAVEVVGLAGEVRTAAGGEPVAVLHGMIAGPDGRIGGGRFMRGKNLVCVTFELAIEEWVVAETPDHAAELRP